MTARRHLQLEQLRHDQSVIRAAAAWVRDQPARGELAALSDPAIAARCAVILDCLADRCERLDKPTREHVVRVARDLLGDTMDRPTVRRTRRRR